MQHTLNDGQRSLTRQMLRALMPAQILTVALTNGTTLLNSLLTGSLLGSDAVAAISFMQPVSLIIAMLAGGIAAGASVLGGRCVGRGDIEGANKILSLSLILSIVLGILLFIGCRMFAEPIAALMGAEGQDLANAAEYLRGLSYGIVFTLFASSLTAFMQLDNCAKTAMLGSGLLLLVNILLIFVFVSVFDLGLRSVGLATSFGYIALILLGWSYYRSEKCSFRLRFDLSVFSSTKDVFYLGLPGMVSPLSLSFRAFVLNKVCFALAGTIGVSAMGVFASLSGFAAAFGCGVGGAAGIISNVFVGERNRRSLQDIGPMAQKTAFIQHYLCYIVVFILAKPLALLFGASGSDLPFMIHAIRASMTCTLVNSFTTVSFEMHKSLGHAWFISLCAFLDYFVFQCLFAFCMKGLIGINAVWFSSIFSELSIYVIMLVYFRRDSRGKKPSLPFDYVYIPENLTVSEESCFDMSIKTMDDVEAASKKLIELCREKGVDSRRAYFCGLCVEEQASNIVLHGFTKGDGDYSIDLRTIFDGGKVIISLRDNCVRFDPTCWCPKENEPDPVKGVGIKMVQTLADSVAYHHTLGLNVLQIVI